MKKNLRRIILLLVAIVAIGKSIYATDATSGTATLFSGYMKFIFIGAALILLVLILFLSYKLDKDEPIVDNGGSVSKKKLNTANKNKTKVTKKKEDIYSNFSESEEDAVYENELDQSDFDSEEINEFEEEPETEENLYQSMEDLDEEYEDVTNKFSDDEEDFESNSLLQEIEDLDEDNESLIQEDDVNFDTNLLDDLDDYEDPIVEKESITELEPEKDNDIEEFNFDTSVLDDLDDYETPNTSSKPLSNSNMSSTPKSKRFTSNSTNSNIGFRNKETEKTDGIGFRNKTEETDSSIGFKRKNKSQDSINKIEKTSTTSKVKKSSLSQDKSTKTSTTSRRKKSE